MRTRIIVGLLVILLTASVVYSQDMQTNRKQFIEELKQNGLILKIEKKAQFPHVYVDRGFYLLNIDQKAQFINVIWAYYKTADPKCDIVVLYDGYSGKQIGKYAEVYGGLEME